MNMNKATMNSLPGYSMTGDNLVKTNAASLPQPSFPGMSIQNNIQNLNLNINLNKGLGGFMPQGRGATAPLGQERMKKGVRAQLNAIGKNKYML